ncbi:MAG: hypothetical protein HYZ37_15210 [Candidatus Solibacter usitatus]|nr:hypothetical protein [Candidatus Solibacter usitatus]
MKRFFVAGAIVALSSLSLSAESWTGTLVDVMCKGKDVANHTRQCALSCAKGGFGLVLSDGKFVKLNEEGNAMTLSKLKNSSKDKDLKAKVNGKLDGDVIQVESLELQ